MTARCETVVRMPTHSEELKFWLISKTESLPGIVMAASLTVLGEGGCFNSIWNMNDEVSVSLRVVDLEECEIETNPTHVDNFVTQGTVRLVDGLRELRKRIRADHLNDHERRAITNICELPGNKLTTTPGVEHAVPTPRMDPCTGRASRNYQILEEIRGELQGIIDQMLRDMVTRYSSSLWNSPIIMMKKKEYASRKEKLLLVVDFRRFNEVTVGFSYPLPLISDILGALSKAQCYTTVDLARGLHQVPLREEDRRKTAYSTPGDNFEFCNMPMGVCSAPTTFQRRMNTVLRGLVGTKHSFI